MKIDLLKNLMAVGFVLFFLSPSMGRTEQDSPSTEELLHLLTTETDVDPNLLRALPAENFQGQEPGMAVGQVQQVQGTVFFIPKGGYGAYHLHRSAPMPVHDGDTLITAKNSRVTLLMNDKSKLTLTPQSKMVIDKSLYDSAAGRRDTKLQLLIGRLRAVVAKITGDNSYSIQTPTATAGVRGTDFALAVGPNMTAVLTGGGDSTVKLTSATGGSLTVGPLSVAGVCPSCGHQQKNDRAMGLLHEIAPELDPAATEREILCLPFIRRKK